MQTFLVARGRVQPGSGERSPTADGEDSTMDEKKLRNQQADEAEVEGHAWHKGVDMPEPIIEADVEGHKLTSTVRSHATGAIPADFETDDETFEDPGNPDLDPDM